MELSGEQPVILGRISGLHGVRGWVKVHSYTEPRDGILAYTECLIERDGRWNEMTLSEGRRHGKTLIAQFDGVDDREMAAALVGCSVGVRRDSLPATGQDEYYWVDLEGLTVVDTAGRTLGSVATLLATGANDVLVVEGDVEILIPFVRGEVVREVDLAAGVITVDWAWD